MKILIACEESQIVMRAFRSLGHEAYSCDIIKTSGFHPEYHLQQDVIPLLEKDWDLIIAFPPCTHLSVSGARWFKEKIADGRQQKAINFFMEFVKAPCDKIAIENPISIMSSKYRKPDQIIHPWQFGHAELKSTCLWLKGLPKLRPTNIIPKEICIPRVHLMGPSKNRSALRSKTYQGIADAMALQWGDTQEIIL